MSRVHEDPVPSVWKTWQGTRPGQGRDLTPMVLALCVGLCALPFVFLLVTPRLGFRAALLTALAVLAGVTVLCWAVCASAQVQQPPTRWWRGRR